MPEASLIGLSSLLRDAVQDVVALLLYVVDRNTSAHVHKRTLGVVTVSQLLEQRCPPVWYGYPENGFGEVKRSFHPAPSYIGRFTGMEALRERLAAPLYVGEYEVTALETADRVHYAISEFGSSKIQDLFRRPLSADGWHVDPEDPTQEMFWKPALYDGRRKPPRCRSFNSSLAIGQLVVCISDDGSDECVSLRLVTATLSDESGQIFRARGELVRPSEQIGDFDLQDACELISDELGALCFAFLRGNPFSRMFRYGATLFFLQDWECRGSPQTAKIAIAETIKVVKRSYVTLSQVVVDVSPLAYERHPPIGLAGMLGEEFEIDVALRVGDLPFGDQVPGVSLYPALPSRELTTETGSARAGAIMTASDRHDDAILAVAPALRMLGSVGLSI